MALQKKHKFKYLNPGIIHQLVEFLYASVDGITDSGCIFEAKHVSPFSFKDVVQILSSDTTLSDGYKISESVSICTDW